MKLFDRYVVIDWSASATPTIGRDSIWLADLSVAGRDVGDGAGVGDVALHNPRTRFAARSLLESIVDGAIGERLLIGLDAGLGYPTGSAEMFGLTGVPWRALWTEITRSSCDDDRNRNNRFQVAAGLNASAGDEPGPFWGCPTEAFGSALRRTKPSSFSVGEFRETERRLHCVGRHPKSCWQLLGAGSVGGQTLTAIPVLNGFLAHVDVWPLATGLGAPLESSTVLVEIWPRLFVDEIPIGTVPDAAQVAGTAHALCEADRAGELAAWFDPDVDDRDAVEQEEGWILSPIEMMGSRV